MQPSLIFEKKGKKHAAMVLKLCRFHSYSRRSRFTMHCSILTSYVTSQAQYGLWNINSIGSLEFSPAGHIFTHLESHHQEVKYKDLK